MALDKNKLFIICETSTLEDTMWYLPCYKKSKTTTKKYNLVLVEREDDLVYAPFAYLLAPTLQQATPKFLPYIDEFGYYSSALTGAIKYA